MNFTLFQECKRNLSEVDQALLAELIATYDLDDADALEAYTLKKGYDPNNPNQVLLAFITYLTRLMLEEEPTLTTAEEIYEVFGVNRE